MSQEILDSVRSIELEAKQLKEEYQQKIAKIDAEAEQKIAEAKRNVEIVLANYEQELQAKNERKKEEFQRELLAQQEATISDLKEKFEMNKTDLIQETVKEVLARYGNR